jgi:hypothetical protein
VFEAVGRAATVETAVACAGRGGVVVVIGVADPGETASIRPLDLFLKELTLTGAWANETVFTRALALLPTLDLNAIITHEFALEQGEQAVALASSGECGKVLLAPNGSEPEQLADSLVAGTTAKRSTTAGPDQPPQSWADMLGAAAPEGRAPAGR